MKKLNTFSLLALVVMFAILSFVEISYADESTKSDFSIGTVSYLSYETVLDADDGIQGGAFKVGRSYLTVKKNIFEHLDFRITLDAYHIGKGDTKGDMSVRLKYIYAHYKFNDFGFLTKPNIEFGLVHTPWLDFEEHINYYRMQGTMFMERAGLFNSADFGITAGAYLGGELDDNYKKTVNNKYPGKYGSFSLGIYNGGGYHALEETGNKTIEGRLTLRPLPDIIPGLQFSYFGVSGKGNKEYKVDTLGTLKASDWLLNAGMISYEHELFTVAGQFISGKGNQKGEWVLSPDTLGGKKVDVTATNVSGFSAFAEIKPYGDWRIIGRFDSFDPNTEIEDNEYTRFIAGIGYDFGGHNILILDYDSKMFSKSDIDPETKIKLTMQIHF